MKVDFDCTK